MSSVGVFTLEELGRIGTKDIPGLPDGSDPELFVWSSDRSPPQGFKGGARACPLQPWELPGQMRTVRTDYPGSKTPSEQILGPRYGNQTITGRFDDRYNFEGYAEQEMARLELVCRRGNLVRIGFQGQEFEGVIVDWSFEYLRDWFIRYRLTLSIHGRSNELDLSDRSPNTAKSASRAYDELTDVVVATIEKDALTRRRNNLEASLGGEAALSAQEALADMEANLDKLGNTLDQREISVNEEGALAVSPFSRLATQMRAVGTSAQDAIGSLIGARADVNVGVTTALNVLNFEDWSRSIRFQSRILLSSVNTSSADMDERAQPNARRLYRPQEGESLYAVSNRFYGTPYAWRLIADRNNLTDFVLSGEELLIIPERGVG